MELQFDKTPCRCLKQVAWEVQNQEQTQEVRLPDALPDIGRVVSSWGQVILRSKEWRSNGMNVSGGVMAWVMYAPEDGSEPRCLETWIPFQMKWDFPEAEREGTICVTPLLRSIDARTVSARKIMVRAGVGILGEALEPWEAEIYHPGELPEGVEILQHTYPVRLPQEAGERTFLLDEELTLPSSCPTADKILRFEIQPEIQDQKVMAGKVIFRGAAVLHVLYRCEDGSLQSWDFEVPFSQYGELEESFSPDAGTRISIAITSLELDLLEDGTFRLKCGMVAQYVIMDQMMIALTEDAYSPLREIVPYQRVLELPSVLDERFETIHAEQSVPVENGRIVDVSFLPDFPRQNRTGDQMNLELPGTFQVLYTDGDDAVQNVSMRWEGQWNLAAAPESQMRCTIVSAGRPQASIGGGSIVAKGDAALLAHTITEGGLPMMTGLEVGELTEPDPGRPSLILRRVGEEQLWDLAKRCGTTVTAIRQANQLMEEPAEGQLLLIPVP